MADIENISYYIFCFLVYEALRGNDRAQGSDYSPCRVLELFNQISDVELRKPPRFAGLYTLKDRSSKSH